MTTAARRLHLCSGSHPSVPQPPQGGADLLEQSPKRQRFAASSRRSGLGREVVVHWRELPEALGLTDREIVSFVGGGGKTTGLFALAATRSGPTVVTTTTKMGRDRTGGLPVLIARPMPRLPLLPKRARSSCGATPTKAAPPVSRSMPVPATSILSTRWLWRPTGRDDDPSRPHSITNRWSRPPPQPWLRAAAWLPSTHRSAKVPSP